MKTLKDILDSALEPIKLDNGNSFTNFLTEEADYEGPAKMINEEDDPFAAASDAGGGAGDDVGGDAGGDAGGADPFGDNAGGADPFGDNAAGGPGGGGGGGTDDDKDGGAGEGGDGEEEEKSPLDDGSHEPDPEFNQGVSDPNDITLSDTPAAKSVYDIEKIMQTVTSVIQTLSEDQLIEIEKVKTAIELIFNGFLLNDEDLEFTNIKNAIFLIKKIAAKLDTKARAYLNRKLKEPLIKKRDEIKQDIAARKGELDSTRDVLTALDTK